MIKKQTSKSATGGSTSKKPVQVDSKSYPLMKIMGKAYWTKLSVPDQFGKFTMDVTLDEKSVKIFEELGLEVRNTGDDRGDFASFTQYATFPDGEPREVEVYNAAMKPFTGGLIGNGSIVNIEFKSKDWSYGGRSGTRNEIRKVQILKHIPYSNSTLKVEEEYIEPSDETAAFSSGQ